MGEGARGGAGGGTLSAIFDTWADADAARGRLLAAGLSEGDVRVVPETPEVQAEGRDVGTGGGFVGALFSVFFPRDEGPAYEEALRRGGVLVVAERVPPALRGAAEAALDVDGAVDLDERAAGWRSEGWAGEVAPGARADDAQPDDARPDDALEAVPADASREAADAAAIRSLTRDSSQGRRVRSYTVD